MKIFIQIFIVFCFASCLLGCQKSEHQASQVIAKVDNNEITVHQLNSELKRQGNEQAISPKAVIDALIDRQLLVNAAIQEKLNQRPEIVQAVEDAKAQIFAEAYLEFISASQKPENEVVLTHKIQTEHPDIFIHHQNYLLEYLQIHSNLNLRTVEYLLFKARQFQDVKQLLSTEGVQYDSGFQEVKAELMPSQFADKYPHGLHIGDFTLIRRRDGIQIIGILEIKPTPLSPEETEILLRQRVKTEINKQLREQTIQRLKALSDITINDDKKR